MPELFTSFVLFAVVATATPGGATALATASGIQFGFYRSVPLLIGIALGLACLAAAAASGLASLLQTLPALELSVRLAGTAYLLWLAYRIGSAGMPGQGGSRDAPISFAGGMLLLLLNPKGWATALGAAASFAALAATPLGLAAIMGATFAAAAIVSLCLWCIGGALLAKVLRTELHWRLVNAFLGLLLVISIIPMWLH